MNKSLAKQINAMVKKDQSMRKSGKWDTKIDKENTKKLKEIIKKHGWPDKKTVGEKASIGAWLIAQHADHDLKFQKKCLKLLDEKVGKCLASSVYLAYLTDRVLVNNGKWQLYGTQFYQTKEGVLKERPIKDKKNLEKRRKLVGLEPFTKYKKRILSRKRGR